MLSRSSSATVRTRRFSPSGASRREHSARSPSTAPRADQLGTATDRPQPEAKARPSPSVEQIRAIPARHPARWIGTALVLAFAALFLIGVSTSKNFQWDVVRRYFATTAILQ